MLILTRKKDESIIIDNKIRIKIISIENNRVQLGVEAPQSVTIYRNEIHEEIQSENIKAVYNKENTADDLAKMLKTGVKRAKREEK